MNNDVTTTVKRLPSGKFVEVLPDGSTRPIESMTDWAAFDALTEEEVTAAALSGPDNPPATEEELAQAKHSTSPKAIRQRLKLTQEQFAAQFQVPLGTLRDWEQGVTIPDSAARNYLRVIAKNPQAVLEALAEE